MNNTDALKKLTNREIAHLGFMLAKWANVVEAEFEAVMEDEDNIGDVFFNVENDGTIYVVVNVRNMWTDHIWLDNPTFRAIGRKLDKDAVYDWLDLAEEAKARLGVDEITDNGFLDLLFLDGGNDE